MTKRWKAVYAGAGAILVATGVFHMRTVEINRVVESTRPPPPMTPPTTSVVELAEAIRAAGDPPPGTLVPSRPNADVNRDGVIELDDILLVLAAFSAEECEYPCPEDICCSGEHRIDLEDIIAVLKASSGETDICPRCAPPTEVFEVFLDDRWVPAGPAPGGVRHVDAGTVWRCRPLPPAAERDE